MPLCKRQCLFLLLQQYLFLFWIQMSTVFSENTAVHVGLFLSVPGVSWRKFAKSRCNLYIFVDFLHFSRGNLLFVVKFYDNITVKTT